MKFHVGDRVRVIAWTMPGITHPGSESVVCGSEGTVDKVRVADANEGADGGYRVELADTRGRWWFRACDLVLQDSPCTCDNTIRRLPVTTCMVHDRPDPDPTAEAAAKLQTLLHDLEDHAQS